MERTPASNKMKPWDFNTKWQQPAGILIGNEMRNVNNIKMIRKNCKMEIVGGIIGKWENPKNPVFVHHKNYSLCTGTGI